MSEGIKPHPRFKFYILILLCLIISIPIAGASSMKPYNVEVTSAFVKATAFCSCGTMSYGYHTSTFENYCPRCKSYGTLKFNPKGSPEGEWTCSKCGADYCAASSKEKEPNSPYHLVPYNPPVVQAQEVITTTSNIDSIVADINKYAQINLLGLNN